MATEQKEVMTRDATTSKSKNLPLPKKPPKLRSWDALYSKWESLLEATEVGSISDKRASLMTTQLRAIGHLGIDVPLRVATLIAKYRGQVKIGGDLMKDLVKDSQKALPANGGKKKS